MRWSDSDKGKAQKEFWVRSETVIAEMTKKNAGERNPNAKRLNRLDWLYFSTLHMM